MSTLSKSNFEAQRNINLVFRREKTVGVYASVVTLANEKLITSTTLYTPPVVRYSLNKVTYKVKGTMFYSTCIKSTTSPIMVKFMFACIWYH